MDQPAFCRITPRYTLSETSTSDSTTETKIKCKICKKLVSRKKMRLHVGAHILKDNIIGACGFCGEKVDVGRCNIEIVKGSGRGQTSSEVPRSGCDYFEKFSLLSVSKGSQRNPCTNRPVECLICKRVFGFTTCMITRKITTQITRESNEKLTTVKNLP